MPKCPKCNEDIDHLIYVTHIEEIASLDEDGDLEHIEQDREEGKYLCPNCRERLDSDLDFDAEQFLKGE